MSPPGIPSFSNRYKLLSVLDSAIGLFIVFPLTCMYWRGAWDLIGHYIFPNRIPMKYWFYIGISHLQIVSYLCLPFLNSYLDPSKKAVYWIVTRVFMYLHAIPYMAYWHGLWLLMNHYMGTGWEYSLVTLIGSWLALLLMSSCRSVMWPPFSLSVDKHPDILRTSTRFKCKVTGDSWKDYIADAFFSQMILLGLAIATWRSLFNIMDRLIFPDDKFVSDAFSAVAGIVGCIIVLSLQVPLGWVSKKLAQYRQYFLKLVWEDSVYTVSFIVLALIWRGVWNLSLKYFFPTMPTGAWINFAIGSVGLISMHVFSEVSAFGIEEDGLDPAGEAFFPNRYLRILLIDWYNPPNLDHGLCIDDGQGARTFATASVNEGFTKDQEDPIKTQRNVKAPPVNGEQLDAIRNKAGSTELTCHF